MLGKRIGKVTLANMTLALALFTGLAMTQSVFAAGGWGESSGKPAEFQQAEKAIGDGKFEAAIPLLEGLVEKNPKDADSLNYLGYSHRKLGRFELSEEYYMKALTADPEHRGAHEYLGELYLQTGRPDKAKEMLVKLDDLCFWGCEEYDELKKAIEQYAAKTGS
ncbi:MAG: tetratricopeptide repeat protein [Kiloniellales bacterium]|nr:tetratricopeptide repeat protein [Kiloniellales bacterium]